MASTYAILGLDATKAEGNSGTTAFTFTVYRNGDITAITSVNWSVIGTGTSPANAADFVGGALPSGTITFAAGENQKLLTINVAGDTTSEPTETFLVNVVDPTNNNAASATGTITNDDVGASSLAIAATSASKNEGNGNAVTAFTFTVTRSGDTTSAATAAWSVAGDGTFPANAADFQGGVLPSGTVSFAAGETSKVITVNVVGDNIIENNEAFTVTLSDASGATIGTATASGYIINDEQLYSYASIGATNATRAEGDSGSTAFTFTVTRGGYTGVAGTVDWAVTGSGDNPANAADFVGGILPSGTLSFGAGETSKTITVYVAGDTLVEQTENFQVTLSNGNGMAIAGNTATGTITNDDQPVDTAGNTIATARDIGLISAVPVVMKEWLGTGDNNDYYKFSVGKTGQVNVSLSGMSVNFNLQILDATGKVIGSSVLDGTTTDTVTLSLAEGSYYARVYPAGTGDSDYQLSFTGQTPDPTTVSIAALKAVQAEGNSGSTPFTFTITRSGSTLEASTVKWAVDGKTTAPVTGADFVGGVMPSGSVTFAAGETSKVITINVAGDSVFEADERFRVVLSDPQGATIGTGAATGVIRNDDVASSFLAIRALDATKNEGDSGSTPFTFTVTRSGDTTGAASANWSVAGTTSKPATADDFTGGKFPTGTITFAAGETSKVITVYVKGDTLYEQIDRFAVTLSNATGAEITTPSATGAILNDDVVKAYLAIAADQTEKSEGTGASTAFTFTVTRTGSTSLGATVDWSVAGSTSKPASADDFVGGAFPSGTITFGVGETTKTITVNVAGDSIVEQDERFTVSLSDPTGAEIKTAAATSIIRNDDVPPSYFGIAAASSDKAEGNSGTTPFTFTITRSGDTTGAGSVAWAVTGSGDHAASAADFVGGVLPAGSVSFAAGETTKTITIGVAGDGSYENDEGFTVTLSKPTGGTITAPTATGTIRNDDPPPDTAGNTIATARDLGTLTSTDTVVNEYLSLTQDTEDYFRFTVSSNGAVTVTVSELSADVDLQLFNAQGQPIGGSYHTGTADESISMTLAAGTYYARAFAYDGDTTYELTIHSGTTVTTTDHNLV
ncbi:pre-peptidase C-terminal domain-containing protein [Acetobacteraceae bacterium H6797]|nr:pre-peptidase C-terminal domain-containing protein [Acetobacteraceae bacterium H6797]